MTITIENPRSDQEIEEETKPKKTRKINRGKKTTQFESNNGSALEDTLEPNLWGSHPDFPPYIQVNSETNKFRCIDHSDIPDMPHRGVVTNHLKTHGVITKNIDEDDEEREEDKKDPEIEHIDKLIEEKSNTGIFAPPQEVVLDNLNKDIADGATKIAKNIHVQFLYAETKGIFPREWEFEDFVLFSIKQMLKSFGIRYGVVQNLEELTAEQLEAVREAKLAWKGVN